MYDLYGIWCNSILAVRELGLCCITYHTGSFIAAWVLKNYGSLVPSIPTLKLYFTAYPREKMSQPSDGIAYLPKCCKLLSIWHVTHNDSYIILVVVKIYK